MFTAGVSSTAQHGLCCEANRSATKQNGSRLGRLVTVVLSEVNSVCNNHSRLQPCSSDQYVLLLNNFSYLNGVTLYAYGKLDGHMDGVLHMLGTVYRWCVAAFSSVLWNILTPVGQVLDGRVVQTHVKIDALCKLC